MSGTQPARGMRDFLPEDVRRRQYVIGVIADVYQRYGFEPLETPAVENIETLLGKYGEEGDKLIFKILKRGEGAQSGEADLALRYDLTVPLARVVAEYRAKLPKFFKRYQVQPVWRADRPQKGRFREFYQCDVDAIGSTSMVIEAELLSAACDVLTRLGFADFDVRLNHRRFLQAFVQGNGASPEQTPCAIAAIDKVDKIGRQGVENELLQCGLSAESAQQLAKYVDEIGPRAGALGESIEDQLASVALAYPDGIDELIRIAQLMRGTGAYRHLRFDPSLARGLSYYTGSIFEIVVRDLAGSLAGGGRYDNLIGTFLGRDVPACGISLGLERILVVMSEREMFKDLPLPTGAADVMILAWPEHVSYAIAVASTLRAKDLRVEVYPDSQDKIDKKIKYAAARGVPCVAIVGDAEAANDSVVVRDMLTREQSTIAREEAAALIKSLRPV